jgi:hypothetical protein
MSEKKRSKYDTDPLDPDFVRRTEEVKGATRNVERTPSEEAKRDPHAEDPTRRLYEPPPVADERAGEKFSTSYPSVFVPPVYQPPQQQTPPHTAYGNAAPPPNAPPSYAPGANPSTRHVEKLGVPEKYAIVAPYAPFFIGLVASIIELLIVPRTETRTRFHAAQGLALQLVILAGTMLFNLVEAITDVGFGGTLFWLASSIFLVVSMKRVWDGKGHHIAPLDELTQKLNNSFEPRK